MRHSSVATGSVAASSVVGFWRRAGAGRWFGQEPQFDRAFREQFLRQHEQAAAGALAHWAEHAHGALSLLLLLDQFPRNAFRGTPRMYATDAQARGHAERAILAGFDDEFEPELRLFFYLPFAHSEQLADQDRSLALHERLGYSGNARRHREIIRRFGRFPHRNRVLGRFTTREEQAYLDAGGFAG